MRWRLGCNKWNSITILHNVGMGLLWDQVERTLLHSCGSFRMRMNCWRIVLGPAVLTQPIGRMNSYCNCRCLKHFKRIRGEGRLSAVGCITGLWEAMYWYWYWYWTRILPGEALAMRLLHKAPRTVQTQVGVKKRKRKKKKEKTCIIGNNRIKWK